MLNTHTDKEVKIMQPTCWFVYKRSGHSKSFKATLCRNWHLMQFSAPSNTYVQHQCHEYKSQVFSDIASHYITTVFCTWQLVSWSIHVCKSLKLPSHWSNIVQKQVIGGKTAVKETPFTVLSQDSVCHCSKTTQICVCLIRLSYD